VNEHRGNVSDGETERGRITCQIGDGVAELVAVLGGAYEAFLRTRVERRAGRRGKVHRRAFLVFVDLVNARVVDTADDQEVAWTMVLSALAQNRCEIEADVLLHGGALDADHEWRAFLRSLTDAS
jgi:hypothetical protein